MLPIFAIVLGISLRMSECDFLRRSRALGPQGLGQLLAHHCQRKLPAKTSSIVIAECLVLKLQPVYKIQAGGLSQAKIHTHTYVESRSPQVDLNGANPGVIAFHAHLTCSDD